MSLRHDLLNFASVLSDISTAEWGEDRGVEEAAWQRRKSTQMNGSGDGDRVASPLVIRAASLCLVTVHWCPWPRVPFLGTTDHCTWHCPYLACLAPHPPSHTRPCPGPANNNHQLKTIILLTGPVSPRLAADRPAVVSAVVASAACRECLLRAAPRRHRHQISLLVNIEFSSS